VVDEDLKLTAYLNEITLGVEITGLAKVESWKGFVELLNRIENFRDIIPANDRLEKVVNILDDVIADSPGQFNQLPAIRQSLNEIINTNRTASLAEDAPAHVKFPNGKDDTSGSQKVNLLVCDKCNSKFYKKQRLRTHMNEKHLRVSRVCPICGLKVGRSWAEHKLTHDEANKKECPHCTKKFFKRALRRHVLQVHERHPSYIRKRSIKPRVGTIIIENPQPQINDREKVKVEYLPHNEFFINDLHSSVMDMEDEYFQIINPLDTEYKTEFDE
jgi:hypothetical protein